MYSKEFSLIIINPFIGILDVLNVIKEINSFSHNLVEEVDTSQSFADSKVSQVNWKLINKNLFHDETNFVVTIVERANLDFNTNCGSN